MSSLNGTNGFVLTGIDPDDRSGYSVSGAGDINGDGFDDLLVGAYAADQSGTNAEGETYVIFGRSGGFASSIALSSLDGNTGFVLTGIDPGDVSGRSVSGAGDINGDGIDDLIIGAHLADQTVPSGQRGQSYVVFGCSGGFASSISLSSLDGTNGFVLAGIDGGDFSGWSVSDGGDVNGDGLGDVIIGARNANQAGGSDHGETYVVFGRSGGFTSLIALSSLNGTTGFTFTGIDPNDHSGFSVSSGGDVNGDGYDDLIIGAREADQGGGVFDNDGESYVVFGRSGGFDSSIALSSLNGTTGFALTGIDPGDYSGVSVSGAGDVNGDGFDDLIIGASRADQIGGSSYGESYVLFGRSGGFLSSIPLSSLNGTNGFVLAGIDPGDYTGRAVSGAGDVNGDGFDDLIVGAVGADQPGGTSHGETYVIFGGNFTGGIETQVGGDGSQTLTANQGAESVDILIGGRGDDTLISDGGNDVLRGGEGDDVLAIPDLNFAGTRRLEGGSGIDTLRIEGVSLVVDLEQIADNRITGIEQIDLNNGGNQLIVTPGELLRHSGTSNNLTVRGGSDDLVVLRNSDWTFQGTVNLGGTDFEQYANGVATLNIEVGLSTRFTVPQVELSALNGATGFVLTGIDTRDETGRSVSSVGDINGDGFDDVIIGAGQSAGGAYGGEDRGKAYVVFGRSDGFASSIALSSLNGTNGFVVTGIDPNDHAGFAVSSAGDVNGDGLDDLLIAAPGADTVNVIFGRSGGFGAAISLKSLNGTNGYRIDGTATGSGIGLTASHAGDVNGDGFADVILGERGADPNGINNAGSSYVVFGHSGNFASAINLDSLDGTNGFRLDGIDAEDFSGYSVSGAGDVNGDSFDDVIIGARFADQTGTNAEGESYVVFGRSGGFAHVFDLSSLNGTNGFVLAGVDPFDYSGKSVSSAGDVNGDGFDDLLVGATGLISFNRSTYVIFGRSGGFAPLISLSSLDGTNGFRADGANVPSSAGDVNGDGFDDLILGDSDADLNGGMNQGASYVLFGRSTGFTSSIALTSLDGTSGFVLRGIDPSDYSGNSVSSAGDVNGDGFDDLIIGSVFADQTGSDSREGEGYVIFGGNFTGGAETQVHREGASTLIASQGAIAVDRLIGGRGNDTLISDGGPDILRGGEGNDTLVIDDVDFSGTRRIVGGNGLDTLRLDGAGLTLDLTALSDNRIVDIEAIDLSGLGSNTLTLNLLEVLNISSSTNTLTIFANDDTLNIGSGWIQQPSEVDSDGFVFEVYTQGAATLRISHTLLTALPIGNGSDDVTFHQNGAFIEVFDNNAAALLNRVSTTAASSLLVKAAPGEANRLFVDFGFGGYFTLPHGIRFDGASGGTDKLDVQGSGATRVVMSLATGTLAAGTLTVHEGGPQTVIAFTEVEQLTATGLLTFDIDGELLVGGDTLSIGSITPLDLGNLTTIAGGSIISSSTVSLGAGESLIGNGNVQAPIAAMVSAFILANGNLTLGDAASFAGYFSDGELHINQHTVTLLDANEAVLGSLTVLGSGGTSGTLTAANGFLLEEGKTLTGQGTVNGEFHNDGDVSGGGTGVVFNDLVTGIGTYSNVTYNGGFSPGHSPAEVALRGTANLGASNTLFIELAGLTPGSQFDRLSSTGTVNVDGTLDVKFINGFVPANGDSFEIIGASAVNGTFDTTNLPTLPIGLEWDVIYGIDAVTLNVFALPVFFTNSAINGGPPNSNRSGIGTLGLTFDLPVNVADVTSLTLFNHTTGQPVDISTASLGGNGSPVVTWNLSSLTLPDGRYTAEIIRSQVNTTVGGPLASAFAFEFHVLSGDIDGDGRVNFNDTVPLSLNFGQSGAAYRDGDGDGDGLVNFNDTVPLSLNFGASLAPLTYDFGDAPEIGTSFPTTLANNGARHAITGNTLFLGVGRDSELDGQPNATATGDGADENGFSFDPLLRGTNVNVPLTSSGAGFVNGWVDFNADGDWDDPGEQVLDDVAVTTGANGLQISVPAGASLGSTFARFRLTGSAGYSYFGLAPNGEVEDYQLTITDPAPDMPAAVAEESLISPSDPAPRTDQVEIPLNSLPDHLIAILSPTFTTFEHPLSLFSMRRESRPLRR